jgi:energy-converting hydrogenase Eha subunit C
MNSMAWLAAAFIALAGIAVILQRRPIARAQALILGGSILPGCAVAQGVFLLLIALAIGLWGG